MCKNSLIHENIVFRETELSMNYKIKIYLPCVVQFLDWPIISFVILKKSAAEVFFSSTSAVSCIIHRHNKKFWGDFAVKSAHEQHFYPNWISNCGRSFECLTSSKNFPCFYTLCFINYKYKMNIKFLNLWYCPLSVFTKVEKWRKDFQTVSSLEPS